MFLDEKINVDVIRQQIPAFFWKRLDLRFKAEDYFLIPIDVGFNYLLRSIRTKWQPINDANGSSRYRNIKLEFIQSYAGRLLQNEPYFARLISTPAEAGPVVASAAISPVDQGALGVEMTATPVKNNLILNYVYQRRETLSSRLRFDINVSGSLQDTIVDILFIGYYMPDRILDEWK